MRRIGGKLPQLITVYNRDESLQLMLKTVASCLDKGTETCWVDVPTLQEEGTDVPLADVVKAAVEEQGWSIAPVELSKARPNWMHTRFVVSKRSSV